MQLCPRSFARTVVVVAVVVVAVAGAAGCPHHENAVVDAGEPEGAGDASDAVTTLQSKIRANFDASTPADPRASALCTALFDMPAKKKDACCKFPPAASGGALFTTCAGIVSDALKDKDLGFDDAKAKACAEQRTAQLDGCGWVHETAPVPPDACDQVFSGALTQGARCRSSLECQKGLRCQGAGPISAGRCGAGLADGSRCGVSVDALAIAVGQPAIDREHPECKNVCGHQKCQSLAPLGAECRGDNECGAHNRCEDKKCVAGRIALGQKCTMGACSDGARCIDGACAVARKDGEACALDDDCAAGGCVKHKGEARGVCGMKCSPLPL